MRLRRLYALLALLALLALVVWAGSALLSPASRAHEVRQGVIATVTPGNQAALPREVSSPGGNAGTAGATPPPTASPLVAQSVSSPAPVDSAAPGQHLEAATPAAVVPVAQPESTDTPFPPLEPAASRVGGPVAAPENHPGRRWVTLQAGHWNIQELPIELQHLAGDSGAYGGGVAEVDLNIEVVKRTAKLLADRGFNVEMLDATVPVSYTTDLFLAIHADGNAGSGIRGFKAVAPWVSVPASDKFVGIFYEEYGKATGLPTDPVTSVAMADYYAFNPITYNHAIDARRVPAALIEMGFVTNPLDRQVMVQQQDRVAWGIANSVDRFFRSGAVGDTPTPYPSFTPTETSTPLPTSTSTPTDTATSTPTQTGTPECGTPNAECGSATVPPTIPPPEPDIPHPTPTPRPTATPLQGIITADGRWLPPLSLNGNNLPQPGSDSPPVFLGEAVDEPVMTPDGRERQQIWQQFYVPSLGRSVWRKGPLLYVRH